MVSIHSFLGRINQYILNPLIVLMFAIALIVFFWGLFEFIRNAGNAEELETGKRNMMWGIFGMVIMVGVFGVASLIIKTFGIDPPPNAYLPQLYR